LVRKLSRRRRVEAIRRICLRVMPASTTTLKNVETFLATSNKVD